MQPNKECSLCEVELEKDDPYMEFTIGILPYVLCQLCDNALHDHYEEDILGYWEATK